MQQLKASVTVQIPDDYVLVEKVKYAELEKRADRVVGDMKWLMEEVNIKNPRTVRDKLLYPFQEELEPFVTYPDEGGSHWKFNKLPMKEWLRKNYKRVWG